MQDQGTLNEGLAWHHDETIRFNFKLVSVRAHGGQETHRTGLIFFENKGLRRALQVKIFHFFMNWSDLLQQAMICQKLQPYRIQN